MRAGGHAFVVQFSFLVNVEAKLTVFVIVQLKATDNLKTFVTISFLGREGHDKSRSSVSSIQTEASRRKGRRAMKCSASTYHFFETQFAE